MWSLFRSRERFSLEELRYLNDQLQGYVVLNDSNKDSVVETLRSIAELMIWGDQHDQQFFEFFMDHKILEHFSRILQIDASSSRSVAIQILQTLNIMIQNFKSETAIYYMFSKEHMNDIISFSFDFKNEELLAYYISFLRTISMKLNPTTVACFIFKNDDGSMSFPLYTEALKFFHHEESMVRIAVRTLTLNVYNVDHEDIRSFVVSKAAIGYLDSIATFMKQEIVKLDKLVAAAAASHLASSVIGRLEASIAETGDLCYYCNDVMSAGVVELSNVLGKHIQEKLLESLLFKSMRNTNQTEEGLISPLTAMYTLSRFIHIFTFDPLLDFILESLSCPGETKGPTMGSLQTKSIDPSTEEESKVQEEVGEKPVESTSGKENGFFDWLSGGKSSGRERGAIGSTKTGDEGDLDAICLNLDPSSCLWEAILSYLLHENERWVMAALCVLLTLFQNKFMGNWLLDSLGILPKKEMPKEEEASVHNETKSSDMLDPEAGTPSIVSHHEEEEVSRNSHEMLPSNSVDAIQSLTLESSSKEEHLEETAIDSASVAIEDSEKEDVGEKINKNVEDEREGETIQRSMSGKSSKNFRQIVDALLLLMCRTPPPFAEVLWHVGWLLNQLLPARETAPLSAAQRKAIENANMAAKRALMAEIVDCWCDVLPSVVIEEWVTCRKMMGVPSLTREPSFVLMPAAATFASEGDTTSLALGERMRVAVKVFVAIHQIQALLLDGNVTETPPLGEVKPPSPSDRKGRKGLSFPLFREGQEVPLDPGDAMPCKVAFERGKEREVVLLVASSGPAGFLILAEEVLPQVGEGVVRVVAPLAGSRPTLDKRHQKWLHLRIRSPQLPSKEAGTLGSLSNTGIRGRVKRLADGRWTLAFPDDQKAKVAQFAVMEEMCIQSNSVRQILEPLLGPMEPFRFGAKEA